MELANLPKIYQNQGDTLYACQYHVLFCTKYRRKVLTEEISAHMKQIVTDLQDEVGFKIQNIDISLDHVHMVLDIPPENSVSGVLTKIKGRTSHILRETYPMLRSRIPTLWTRVIFVSSVGNVALNDLEAFLEKQKKR